MEPIADDDQNAADNEERRRPSEGIGRCHLGKSGSQNDERDQGGNQSEPGISREDSGRQQWQQSPGEAARTRYGRADQGPVEGRSAQGARG